MIAILIAALHAVPIVLISRITKSCTALHWTVGIMCVVAIVSGGRTFSIVDLLAILVAYMFVLPCARRDEYQANNVPATYKSITYQTTSLPKTYQRIVSQKLGSNEIPKSTTRKKAVRKTSSKSSTRKKDARETSPIYLTDSNKAQSGDELIQTNEVVKQESVRRDNELSTAQLCIQEKTKVKIERYVEQRGIQSLLHFTHIENLLSILEHGIVPRKRERTLGLQMHISDAHRYDGQLDAINMSISFPNYKMFYRKRREDESGIWVVLCVSASVLWERQCSFYTGNAADPRHNSGARRSEIQHLEEMFSQEVTNNKGVIIHREEIEIPENYTTDPQAEVLVHDIITTNYISSVCFSSEKMQKDWDRKLTGMGIKINTCLHPPYFNPRPDYKYWPSKRILESCTT